MLVTTYIAVGKIRIQKLCLNGISDPSDPNACKLQVLLIAVLSLLLSVCMVKVMRGLF